MLGIARTVGRSSAPQYTASYLLLLRLSISSFAHMKKNNRISINVGFKIKGQVELFTSYFMLNNCPFMRLKCTKCRLHIAERLVLAHGGNRSFR